jgi:hypothetical protein
MLCGPGLGPGFLQGIRKETVSVECTGGLLGGGTVGKTSDCGSA